MLGKLLSFFKKVGSGAGSAEAKEEFIPNLHTDKLGTPTDKELLVSTAVLLIEMASSDSDIAREEAEMVCTLLEQHLGIPQARIPDLVQDAIMAKQEKGKIHEFLNVINERYSEAQRKLILGLIWKMVVADGKIEASEEQMAQQMRTKLRLPDEAGKVARRWAEQGLI
jgi:uncharacterized tellurite resistance protein B-like protein